MKTFLAFLLFPLFTLAQTDTGYLHLYIYPDQCKVIINDSLAVNAKSKLALPQGLYKINISGAKLKTVTENIKITKDSTLVYRKIMGASDSYRKYKSELTEYNLKKAAMITSTTLLAGLTLYLTYNYTFQAKKNQDKAYENAINNKKLYDTSFNTTDMIAYESAFNKNKDDYYKFKKQVYYAIPVALVGSFLTYQSYKYTKSIKKPKYIESLGFNYNIFNNQFYLSYDF